MSRHTPGPWLREGNTVYALMHAGWRKGGEQFKNRFSAYVQADRECSDDEHEANARLIAAAPELLEALRDMLAGWKYIRSMHGDLYGVGWDRAQGKAEAAWAKATGEQA